VAAQEKQNGTDRTDFVRACTKDLAMKRKYLKNWPVQHERAINAQSGYRPFYRCAGNACPGRRRCAAHGHRQL
jgi:hypothetical protein